MIIVCYITQWLAIEQNNNLLFYKSIFDQLDLGHFIRLLIWFFYTDFCRKRILY